MTAEKVWRGLAGAGVRKLGDLIKADQVENSERH